jgi:hypothetical protein
MRLTIILFLLTVLLFNCSTNHDNDVVYAIVKHDTIVKPKGTEPPQLPKPFYGNYNFILLDSSKIFYHKKNKRYSCGYGLDHTRPFHVSLAPKNLTEIKINELEVFLKSIPDSITSDRHFYASVSSPKDTIKNRAYKIIADFFKSKNIKYYNTRNLTEEEQYVLISKLENKKYDPQSVNWIVGFGDIPKFAAPNEKKDNISIWTYDYVTDAPVKNRDVKADTLTPGKLVNFINTHKGGSKIHLDLVKLSHDTIYVKIKESTYLTQQMGTSGAEDYMTTTTFTLTELKNVKFVTYDFKEGDHAAPGTYSREYYTDRNKRNSEK